MDSTSISDEVCDHKNEAEGLEWKDAKIALLMKSQNCSEMVLGELCVNLVISLLTRYL